MCFLIAWNHKTKFSIISIQFIIAILYMENRICKYWIWAEAHLAHILWDSFCKYLDKNIILCYDGMQINENLSKPLPHNYLTTLVVVTLKIYAPPLIYLKKSQSFVKKKKKNSSLLTHIQTHTSYIQLKKKIWTTFQNWLSFWMIYVHFDISLVKPAPYGMGIFIINLVYQVYLMMMIS